MDKLDEFQKGLLEIEEKFEENIEKFLKDNGIEQKLSMVLGRKRNKDKMQVAEIKYHITLDKIENEEVIKKMKRKGWKEDKDLYNEHKLNDFDNNWVILSYIPFKFIK